jgi:uncharacterized RDD family membrane protein YckC
LNEPFNPYSPPRANVDLAEERREIVPVGKGRRFATYLIDYVFINVLMFVVVFGVVIAFGPAGQEAVQNVNDILLAVPFFLVYYIVFEGIWARTPAKFILGTVVVTADGAKPRIGKIFIRTLCRLIPFEPFSFFRERGERGWHDSIPDTWVVSTRG